MSKHMDSQVCDCQIVTQWPASHNAHHVVCNITRKIKVHAVFTASVVTQMLSTATAQGKNPSSSTTSTSVADMPAWSHRWTACTRRPPWTLPPAAPCFVALTVRCATLPMGLISCLPTRGVTGGSTTAPSTRHRCRASLLASKITTATCTKRTTR